MEIKVIQFQITDGWLYVLYDDGEMARKYIKQPDTVWEKVELPEVKSKKPILKEAIQSLHGKRI